MKIRRLTEADVTFALRAEPEHESPADFFSSGDDDQDNADVHAVWKDLDAGNQWAWCTAVVTATWTGAAGTFTGTASLGCCNYDGEEQFRANSATMAALQIEALSDLNRTLARMADVVRELEEE